MINKIILSVFLAGYFYSSGLCAQQGKVDVTFNAIDDGQKGDGFDNIVRTLCLQSDQKLIVGGDYLSLNGISCLYLARLNSDGTIDETFHTGTGFNGKIYTSYIQSDGKIIVGGSFTAFDGINCGRLVRLNKDGSYDATFDTAVAAASGIIYNICPQSDGKIIVTGSFTKYNNSTVNRVARILRNGTLDTTFQTGLGAAANITNASVLPDGKILLTGNFTTFNTVSASRIVRLLPNGEVDMNFNSGTGFNDDVNAIFVQSDGKIILGGKFTNYNGSAANRIIRLNQNGSIDNDFTTGSGFSNDAVEVVKMDSSGNIMVGGSFTGFYNGTAVNRICLLHSNGILKTDFDSDAGPGSGSVLALEMDAENLWYIGGSFSVFDGLNQGRLVKINANGEREEGYLSAGIGFDNSVLKVLPLADKKIVVLGNFKKFNGNFSPGIARVLGDGSYDASFNSGQSGANNLIKSGVIQKDGKIILGGNFTKYNDIASGRIIRVLPDGAIDHSFNTGSGLNGQVYAMAIQSDEKVIVAGNFTSYNGIPAIRIIRLLQNGSRDTSFDTALGADATIEAIAVQPDGKIIIGGRFNSFNTNSFARLVRLNPNGSMDSGFRTGTGFDKNVYAIELQSDQKIIVGGSFLSYNGTSQKRIARLNTDGSLDATFESGTGFSKGEVRCILIQPDDRILVGGTFSGTYKTKTALRLIRLQKSGDYDPSFESQLNNKLFTMSFTPDYKMVIGGNFNSVSGISKHRIARIKLCVNATVWDGGTWSNGLPSEGKEIEFKKDYANLTSANVCSCSIDKDKKVTLLSGNTLGVEFSYSGLGILILENAASFYQSDDDVVNTGVVHLKRNSTPIRKFDYTYWSSPIDRQKLLEVSSNSSSERFYSYDYTVKDWFREKTSSIMILGKGYIIQGPKDFSVTEPAVFEATFKGVPNNGKIEISLGESGTFNLVGNPYPSALDADIFLAENKTRIKGTLYFWTHNTPVTNSKYTSDDYAVYNLLGGVGTRKAVASGINETVPDGIIASGQAFFVSSKGPQRIVFNDTMRIGGRNTSFFKSITKGKETETKSKVDKHRLWLNFKNSEGVFKQILIGYIHDATNLYDVDYDAESINGNPFVNFYSIVENKKVVIQGRALPFVQEDSIPLGYKTSMTGKFSFSIDHEDGFFKDLNVFVRDKDLKISHNLKERPYSFYTQEGSFDERFMLCFVDKSLAVNDFQSKKQDVFISVQNKVIKVISTRELISDISVYDILGKELCHKKNIESLEFELSNLQSNNQFLLVKVRLGDGRIITRKILF